jgi:hypothetical protein
MPKSADLPEVAPPTLIRLQITEQIQARLDGKISDAQLAKWAFDRFYKIELEELQLEETHAEVLSDVLDELMFADDSHFRLEDAHLHTLLARLAV